MSRYTPGTSKRSLWLSPRLDSRPVREESKHSTVELAIVIRRKPCEVFWRKRIVTGNTLLVDIGYEKPPLC